MNDSPTGEALSPEAVRAEELLDDLGERAASWMAELSARVVKATALAREEMEDIWAEAQDLRCQ